MRKTTALHFALIFAALLFGLNARAQVCTPQRYLQAQFDVDTLIDVVYGNAPSMPAIYVAENVTVPYDLKMDIYMPEGDTQALRPCVLMAFGGGFLIGSKEDEDIRSVCDSLARKGYVAASINYRLGLNTASNGSAERAVWRGAQDWSAAIRFLKENHATYRLDTNSFFAGGASAGSFGAMHCQFATDAQRPASTYSAGLPFPQPDLGCKDCSGNTYAHTSSVRGLINCWGAIGDTAWIDAQDSVRMVSFHGDLDAIVPYGYGFPFTALLTLPQVYGSSLIDTRMQNLGLSHRMNTYNGEGHNIWGTIVANEFTPSPTAYWEPILDSIRLFLWDMLEPHTGPISGAASVAEMDVHTYRVPADPSLSRYCWTVNGGTILSTVQDVDSIVVRWDQAGVRAVRVRPVSKVDAVGPEEELLVQVLPLGAAAAPVADIAVQVSQGQGMLWIEAQDLRSGRFEVALLDAGGRVVRTAATQAAGTIQMELDTRGLSAGIYMLRMMHRGKVLTRKVALWD